MGSQKKKSVRKRAKMTTRDESFFGLGDIFTKDVLTAPGFAMPQLWPGWPAHLAPAQ